MRVRISGISHSCEPSFESSVGLIPLLPCASTFLLVSPACVSSCMVGTVPSLIRLADRSSCRLRCVLSPVYLSTPPDPVAEFSTPILTHMNDDHPETTKAMVEHYITGGVEVSGTHLLPAFCWGCCLLGRLLRWFK